MAWDSVPTAEGQATFARGRLRKWAKSIEKGARLDSEDPDGRRSDPDGLTAHMMNGRTILGYRLYSHSDTLRYAVLDRDGAVMFRDTRSLSGAIGQALGGYREFAIGQSKVSVRVEHKSNTNQVRLDVVVNVPNPNAEWDDHYQVRLTNSRHNIKDSELIVLAVGILTQGDDPLPLLDKVEEFYPGSLNEAVGCLWESEVPKERLKRWKTRVTQKGDPEWNGSHMVLYQMVNAATEEPLSEWMPFQDYYAVKFPKPQAPTNPEPEEESGVETEAAVA